MLLPGQATTLLRPMVHPTDAIFLWRRALFALLDVLCTYATG